MKPWLAKAAVTAMAAAGLAGALWLTADAGEGRRSPRQPPPEPQIRLISDPEVDDLLKELGAPLAEAARLPEGRVRYHVILDSRLNAMALPSQHLLFNSGLVLAVRNRDELAAVMAHETAHLAAGHHIQLSSAARGAFIQTLATMAAGLVAGIASRNSDLMTAGMIGGAASGQATMLEELRRKETQADRLGIGYLAKSGFDPNGMPGFMDRLNRESRLSGMPPPYLLTHPMSSMRLTEARDQAEQTPPAFHRPDDREGMRLARIQAKLKAATAIDPTTAEAEFRQQLREKPKDFPARYGLAMSLSYGGNLKEADQIFTELLQESNNDPYILRERGLARLDGGELKGAEADIRAALVKLKDHADMRYRLAFVLNQAGKEDEAAGILHRLTLEEPEDGRYLYLLGMVEGKRNNPGLSNLALARFHRGLMEKGKAIWHYKESIKQLTQGSGERMAAVEELKELEHPRE